MAKKSIIFVSLICFSLCANALNNSVKDELKQLDEMLAQRPLLETEKRHEIDSLSRAAAMQNNGYDTYRKLLEQYKSYNYDTALMYIRFMEKEASPQQLPELQLDRAFVYLSGGLFKEASDVLDPWLEQYNTVLSASSARLDEDYNRNMLIMYYVTHTRLLWDLADNVGGELADKYNEAGIGLIFLITPDFLGL